MKKSSILSLTILFFFSFLPLFSYDYVEPVYGKMADRISAKTAKILIKRHNMYVIGSGGGFIDHVNMLALSFLTRKSLDIKEARSIIIDCIDEFLYQINSDEEIRPYLKHFPFTPADVEIFVQSTPKDEKLRNDPSKVAMVSSHSTIKSQHTYLRYTATSKEDLSGFKDLLEEDYGEALRIVNESKKLLLDQSKCQTTPTQAM